MTLKRLFRIVALVAITALPVAPLGAQTPQTPSSQDGFVPVDQLGDPKEELPATPLVAGAYAIAWAAVLVYVWSVWRRLNQVDRELADVSRRLQPGARQ